MCRVRRRLVRPRHPSKTAIAAGCATTPDDDDVERATGDQQEPRVEEKSSK